MDQKETDKYTDKYAAAQLERWSRRSRWEEWSSPVGLGLAWALFILPIGLFVYLLHLAGLVG